MKIILSRILAIVLIFALVADSRMVEAIVLSTPKQPIGQLTPLSSQNPFEQQALSAAVEFMHSAWQNSGHRLRRLIGHMRSQASFFSIPLAAKALPLLVSTMPFLPHLTTTILQGDVFTSVLSVWGMVPLSPKLPPLGRLPWPALQQASDQIAASIYGDRKLPSGEKRIDHYRRVADRY